MGENDRSDAKILAFIEEVYRVAEEAGLQAEEVVTACVHVVGRTVASVAESPRDVDEALRAILFDLRAQIDAEPRK